MKDKFWQNKVVIVTGANGFVASHLTVNLLNERSNVIGIIKEQIPASYLALKLKEHKYSNLKLINGDIADYNFIKSTFKRYRPDVCLHVAAQAIVGIANNSPIPTFKTNIQGTWNILEAIREFSPHTKIVVASSDKAYGEHEKLPYKEEAALQALHPYDASKACTDILSRTYAHTYNLSLAVTRCANIYGPGDLNFSRIIPDTIRSVILGKDPIIRSDGSPLRDYIFIEDIVRAYLILAKHLSYKKNKISGQAFNFGSGKPISVLGLVNLIIKISESKGFEPEILSKKKIRGEIDRQYLDSKKAGDELGWHPRYSLKEGLIRTLKWYRIYLFKGIRE